MMLPRACEPSMANTVDRSFLRAVSISSLRSRTMPVSGNTWLRTAMSGFFSRQTLTYVAQNRDVRLLFEANPHQRGNDLVGWSAIPEQALECYRLQPEPVYGLETIFQHGAYGAMFGVARQHDRRPCAAGIQQFAQRKLQGPGGAIVQRNPLGVHAQKGFQIPEEGTHTAPGNRRTPLRQEAAAGIRVRWRYKTGARSQFLLECLVGRGTVGGIEASDIPIQLVDGGSPLNTLGVGHDGQVLQ